MKSVNWKKTPTVCRNWCQGMIPCSHPKSVEEWEQVAYSLPVTPEHLCKLVVSNIHYLYLCRSRKEALAWRDPSWTHRLMNIASQLFKRATFPLSGNNVVVQNLLRKLSTSCFFRMSLCLQLIKRPVFTAKLAGNRQGTALNSDCLLPLWGGSTGHNGVGEARWRPQW